MKHHGIVCQTASATPLSAEELEKQRRKENTRKFLAGIRARLDSVVNQLALSPAEAAIACSHWPAWAYRKINRGEWRVVRDENGEMRIPRSEIVRWVDGARKYKPKRKTRFAATRNGGAK